MCVLLQISFLFWTSFMSRRRQWQPTPVLLPGKSHGWRSLVGSSWGRYKSDTTERLHFHFSVSCIGEGNGNPLKFLPGESQGRGSLVDCRLWSPPRLSAARRESGSRCHWLGEAAPQPECCSVCAQKAPARPGLPWSCPPAYRQVDVLCGLPLGVWAP